MKVLIYKCQALIHAVGLISFLSIAQLVVNANGL